MHISKLDLSVSSALRRGIGVLLGLALLCGLGGNAAHAFPSQRPHNSVAADCNMFVSPTGAAANSGASPESPLTLAATYRRVQPGSVVCLLPGTYNMPSPLYINTSGTADAYIKYTSYDTAQPAQLIWTGNRIGSPISIGSSYVEVSGLMIDAANRAMAGVMCRKGGHHLRIVGNTVNDGARAAIAAEDCDYLEIVGNKAYRASYAVGDSSAIAFGEAVWWDRAPGFHSIIANNIVSGSYDGDKGGGYKDGNGIAVDLGGETPPVLVANNLIFMNGGRCIATNTVTDVWIINNTCYANTLGEELGKDGNFSIFRSKRVVLANNIASAWTRGYAVKQVRSTEVSYYRNTYNGGLGLGGVEAVSAADSQQLLQADPLFADPIALNPTAEGQYRDAMHPDQVGYRFQLQADSPLIDYGIDPNTLPGVTPLMQAQMAPYLGTDLKGMARPAGNGYDVGAYEQLPVASKNYLPLGSTR